MKERERQEAAKRQRMERRANLQLRSQNNGHVALGSVSETLTEVTEEASSASTSVKETSFVFSFKRKSTRRGSNSQCC